MDADNNKESKDEW